MRHIFYSSQSADMDGQDYDGIVRHAIEKNRRNGIHGSIAWDGRVITQIIEGPAEAVDALYCAIRADRRHTGVVLLTRADITKSLFPDFGMTKRAPYDLYMISLAISDRYGTGDTSAVDLDGSIEPDLASRKGPMMRSYPHSGPPSLVSAGK